MVFKNKEDREKVIAQKEFTLNDRTISCNAYEPKDQTAKKPTQDEASKNSKHLEGSNGQ